MYCAALQRFCASQDCNAFRVSQQTGPACTRTALTEQRWCINSNSERKKEYPNLPDTMYLGTL